MLKSNFFLVGITLLGLGCSLSFAEQKTSEKKPQSAPDSIKQVSTENDFSARFNKLPTKTKEKYAQLWSEMQFQIQGGNNLGILQTTDKLEEEIGNNPSIFNIRGATYLKLKEIEKSKENFTKACELAPMNESFQFNLAETFFVSHEYKKAIKMFDALLSQIKQSKEPNLLTKSLIQFKIFLCYTKLGDKEKAAELSKLYSIHDDTPFYYCTKGVNEQEAGNKSAAQKSFLAAMNIYGMDGMYQPFADSLTETGFIDSIEGPTVPIPPPSPEKK